jgi:molybdenum cofactor guanylyltransferase
MNKHTKHVQLTKPEIGQFARTEYAIIGAPCDLITSLVNALSHHLSGKIPISYLDASHAQTPLDFHSLPSLHLETNQGGIRIIKRTESNEYDLKLQLQNEALLLVNGNHFQASKQIVILHRYKKESLSRKTDRLTHIDLVLTTPEQRSPYEFLDPFITSDTTTIPLGETAKIAEWLAAQAAAIGPPKLNGLVLAGGKSTRMGQDKSAIVYHEKSQQNHTAQLLSKLCEKVSISLRSRQDATTAGDFPVIEDTFTGLGPLGAILSALREEPNSAWLVVACDLPYLDLESLEFLVSNRNPGAIATAYRSDENAFPEPLVAIWEPASYQRALRFLGLGISCPRKVLINSDVHLVTAGNPEILTNVNTIEEKEEALKRLGKSK